MSHYGFRISVGTRSIMASRRSGWPPREWEAVVVLVQAAVLAEWQEKPRDKTVCRVSSGRIRTRGVTGHR